eukprot:gene5609-9432_t
MVDAKWAVYFAIDAPGSPPRPTPRPRPQPSTAWDTPRIHH